MLDNLNPDEFHSLLLFSELLCGIVVIVVGATKCVVQQLSSVWADKEKILQVKLAEFPSL